MGDLVANKLNYKKPQFWLIVLGIIIVIFVGINLFSGPRSDNQLTEKTREDYADLYLEEMIKMYEQSFKIIDQRITRFEKISTFDGLLCSPVELWEIEYRLKPEDTNQVQLAGGIELEDGWLTEDGSMGRPIMVFSGSKERLEYLGILYSGEYILDTPAAQETALQQLLENKGFLTPGTYPGEHQIVLFPLSTGETCQLFLSQPVKQGKDGLWVVERWMDGNGAVYYEYPKTQKTKAEYYQQLQLEVDNGHQPGFIDPLEVALDFVKNNLRQRQITKEDLLFMDSATMEDFLETPESRYLGYLMQLGIEQDEKTSFHLDKIEWLTEANDQQKLKALGINPESLPNGYYIHHLAQEPMLLQLTKNTQYFILDWAEELRQRQVSFDEFITRLGEYNDFAPPFWVITKDGYVKSITEQYIP